MPGKIRLTVDVRDSTLLPLAENRLNAQRRKPERRASDEQPVIFERRSRVGCDVPAGSYLAICMGLHEQPVIPFTATGPVTGVEPGGATHFEARTDANRLVVFIVRREKLRMRRQVLRSIAAAPSRMPGRLDRQVPTNETAGRSRKNWLHDLAMHVRKAEVAALELVD